MNDKAKKGCAVGCLGVIVLIVIILIIAASIDATNKGDKKGATKKSQDTSLPIVERIEFAVLGTLGEKNNMSNPRAISVILDDNNTTISFFADESSDYSSLESDIIDVMKSIKEIENLDTVTINAQASFVDKYGNKSIDNALAISIDKSEIEKINLSNFYVSTYALHPAYKK